MRSEVPTYQSEGWNRMKSILHLGYPKTGTTFLQRKLFPQLSQTHAVITPEFENCGVNIKSLKQKIQSGAPHGTSSAAIRERPFLFSMEGLLFDAIRGEDHGKFAPRSFMQALAGLKAFCEANEARDVEIVLYVRRQDELIHSLYAESKTFYFNQIPQMQSLPEYVDTVLQSDQTPEEPGYYYHFTNTVKDVRQVFPDNAIHIRFYEVLSDDLASEVEFWSKLTGATFEAIEGRENSRRVDEHSKSTDPESLRTHAVRLKNRYLPGMKLPNRASQIARGVLNKVQFRTPEIIKIDQELRRRIRAHFIASNLALAAEVETNGQALPECYLQAQTLV